MVEREERSIPLSIVFHPSSNRNRAETTRHGTVPTGNEKAGRRKVTRIRTRREMPEKEKTAANTRHEDIPYPRAPDIP
jgi:hypothetical protein